MLENAYYSVITPEGCASILWDGEGGGPEKAAEILGLHADKLLELGIVDIIIKEPLGGAHHGPASVARELKKELVKSLKDLSATKPEELVEKRYTRLRSIGHYTEDSSKPTILDMKS
jgi:acetyl-CoA carboxylase carboxyl transferase subunit alpha